MAVSARRTQWTAQGQPPGGRRPSDTINSWRSFPRLKQFDHDSFGIDAEPPWSGTAALTSAAQPHPLWEGGHQGQVLRVTHPHLVEQGPRVVHGSRPRHSIVLIL